MFFSQVTQLHCLIFNLHSPVASHCWVYCAYLLVASWEMQLMDVKLLDNKDSINYGYKLNLSRIHTYTRLL